MTTLEQLKALASIQARTLKEAEKIDSTIQKTLRAHPELEQPFKMYMCESVPVCNFEFFVEDQMFRYKPRRRGV